VLSWRWRAMVGSARQGRPAGRRRAASTARRARGPSRRERAHGSPGIGAHGLNESLRGQCGTFQGVSAAYRDRAQTGDHERFRCVHRQRRKARPRVSDASSIPGFGCRRVPYSQGIRWLMVDDLPIDRRCWIAIIPKMQARWITDGY
jgi:hypothetical protein